VLALLQLFQLKMELQLVQQVVESQVQLQLAQLAQAVE
jgi:hypothetical protein